MTAHQTTTLIIRLLGPVWFLYLLNQVGAIAALLDMGSVTRPGIVFVICMLVVQLFCAAMLWLRPATIAAKLLPSTLSDRPQPSSSPLQWQTVAVICIGLWQLADALPHFIYLLTLWRAAMHSAVPNAFDEAHQASLLATLIRIAIGLWFTLGAKGFSMVLFKVRTAGLNVERPGGNAE